MMPMPAVSFGKAGSITAPVATDDYWDNVAFLMYGEGADGATTFYDRSKYARAVTRFGAAQMDTDIPVKTSPSMLFGADANYLTRAYGPELNIGVGSPDFCMEAYVYCTDVSQHNQIFGRRRNSDNYIMSILGNTIDFRTFSGTTATVKLSVAAGMSNNTVHHVCVIRVGTTYYGFVDGVLKGSNTSSAGQGIDTTGMVIANSETDQPARYWYGNLNWLRITMGVPRYALTGFTPPSTPLVLFAPRLGSLPLRPLSRMSHCCSGSTELTEMSPRPTRVATLGR